MVTCYSLVIIKKSWTSWKNGLSNVIHGGWPLCTRS